MESSIETGVFWDITARCNGRCCYCSVAKSLRRDDPAEPSLESVVASLDRLIEAGVASLVLLGGEPTLRLDLVEIVFEARKRGLRVGIATNGLAMSEPLRRTLLENNELSINFSLDSFFAEENDAVRGTGYHAACLRNLKALLTERAACRSLASVTIHITLTKRNTERLEETLLSLLDLGADRILVDRMRAFAWHTDKVKALALRPRDWIPAAGKVARTAMRLENPGRLMLNFGHVSLKAVLAERYGYPVVMERSCPAGLEVAVVDFAGDLHPCRAVLNRPVPVRPDRTPWYTIRPPNIRSIEASSFLRSAYFVDFYNFAHSARVYERLSMCKECPHYEVCEPCPLDVMTFGDHVLEECRLIAEGYEP